MDKIKKIRQEIERLKKQEKENEKAELMSDSWILGRQVMLEHFEHFLNTLSEEPCKSLEEAAEEYIKNGRYLPEAWVVRPAFKAGAEWQASQMPMPEDTVLFQKGVAEGRRLEREDMLKDAMEGYVNYYEDSGGILMAEAQVGCPYHNGDKVHIIVVKDESK